MANYSTEQMREYMRRYRAVRMADAHARLGGKCVECGTMSDLQFDHVDPTTKVKPLTTMLHASKAKWEAELVKCQLLCGDCHRAKHACGHGWTRYRLHGCRCDVCRVANTEAARRYRANKRSKAR